MTHTIEPTNINESADFWRYDIGVNVIPADTVNKKPTVLWSEYQDKPIPESQHEQWKEEKAFSKGIAIIPGKVWHREDKKDLYFIFIDADKHKAIEELGTRNGKTISLDDMSQKFLVERHADNLEKAHIYFYSPLPFPKKSADILLGLEIKGLGEHGIAFCSTSIHMNGYPYEIIGIREPACLSPEQASELIQHIDQICINYGLKYLENNFLDDKMRAMTKSMAIDKTVKILSGQRHNTLIAIANSILFRHLGATDEAILKEFFLHVNNVLCHPEPLKDLEANNIWKSAFDFVMKNKNENENEKQQLEQLDNGSSQVQKLVETIMSSYQIKTLIDTEEILYYKDGIYHTGGEQSIKIELEKIAGYSMRINTRNEIIAHIKYRTMAKREDFDSDINIVNVRNGLLNIITGDLRPHTSEYLSFIQLPVNYDPNATCLKIIRFLVQVLSKQDISKIIRAFGYCLYKSNRYEKAFMFVGPGRNGKSVLIKLIEALVGHENVSHGSLQELLSDRFASADLYCKLVNAFADLEADKLISTGRFKTLVSGDSIRAQRKHQHAFSFRNFAKLFFSTNKIPESEDKSYAYYRRWLILSFDRMFEGEHEDTGLIDKLTTENELSGLLNLALKGLSKLIKEGGFKDTSVEKIKQQYEHNASIVKQFIDEQCIIDLNNPNYCILTTTLQNSFLQFCKTRGSKVLENNILGRELFQLGITKERIKKGQKRDHYYFGIMTRQELKGKNESLIPI